MRNFINYDKSLRLLNSINFKAKTKEKIFWVTHSEERYLATL